MVSNKGLISSSQSLIHTLYAPVYVSLAMEDGIFVPVDLNASSNNCSSSSRSLPDREYSAVTALKPSDYCE